ncbi:MAG: hypothetical protein IJC01_00610 [Clostridia bacterium]|nr:hypothetical protein [Clostridia bacterium]
MVDCGQVLCYNQSTVKIEGDSVVFFGTYFHQMDAKNRIRIPAKFGKDLGSTYVLGRSSIEGALAIYTADGFKRVSKKTHSPFNKQAEKAYSLFFGSYFEVSEDGQGRLQISDAIRKLVNLEKDVVSIGAEDHINLMSKSRYDKLMEELSFEDALSILDDEFEKSNS